MRILLANPNTSADVTEILLAAARRAASPGTEILGATAPRGVPYIANQAEAQVAGAVALDMLAERAGDYDAAVIAAFGDPGLLGARELLSVPVVGLAEAAMLTACLVGRRFGIVTFSTGLVSWYRDCVDLNGLATRCAGIRALGGAFASLASVGRDREDALVAAAHRMVEEDGADVLVFAGAPLSGLARRVAHRLPVPVVEQVAAAIRQAEILASLDLGTRRRNPPKASEGLPSPLAALIAGDPPPPGSRRTPDR